MIEIVPISPICKIILTADEKVAWINSIDRADIKIFANSSHALQTLSTAKCKCYSLVYFAYGEIYFARNEPINCTQNCKANKSLLDCKFLILIIISMSLVYRIA